MSSVGLPRVTGKTLLLFLLFVASGFCGLLYQVVWVRLAFAAFGVITPVLSVVLSVFMLGLALGSWAGGRWIGPLTNRFGRSSIWFYSAVELLIGLSAWVVPLTFGWGESWLLPVGEMGSTRYLILSAVILSLSLLPWCFLMGTTFPVMMSYIKEDRESRTDSFSYLYVANVIGAMCGTLLTALVLIEVLGFRRTLMVAGCTNFLIGAVAALLGTRSGRPVALATPPAEPSVAESGLGRERLSHLLVATVLFSTGFISMAMEVVWTRASTPILWTTIYSFASLLAVYLLATWVGSLWYRIDLHRKRVQSVLNLMAMLTVAAFLPILANDPRMTGAFFLRASVSIISIFPFCMLLGYLTPRLIDGLSGGNPKTAGRVYALNIVGCILGPLAAGYVLLPTIGIRISLILLSLVFGVFYLWLQRSAGIRAGHAVVTLGCTCVLTAVSLFGVVSYEDRYDPQAGRFFPKAVVRRDHVATVVSLGEGMEKRLFVNGLGLTHLTTITKIMAHFPMGVLKEPPQNGLVICLGMGTTFRSMTRWGCRTTAVELVPSVRDAFGYYYADAESILKDSRNRIVVDDGRRFLNRTSERFDIVTIDPPPPIEAAGSSLLYSEEFYRLIKSRLTDRGILAQWSPGGTRAGTIVPATVRAIRNVFPCVRMFSSVEGWGYHLLASAQPFDMPDEKTFLARLPEAARRDLVEWCASSWTPERIYTELLRRIMNIDAVSPSVLDPTITDDRPYNEYFFLRDLKEEQRPLRGRS